MKLRINITKEIIKKAMWCNTSNGPFPIASNCAIAVAVRDIFPMAAVGPLDIFLGFIGIKDVYLPLEAQNFIYEFDKLWISPKKRLELDPISFEIDIPEEVISMINIEDIHKSETLELVP
jgi:hypothetical protein